MSTPLVAVIMGSTSDWETMTHAVEALERFGVPYEKHVVSAHRTPVWMAEFAQGAEARGIEVIIAGAGGAAHLPGMTAAHTLLPVLGVPVQTAALNGLDSLLSIVQMPGGVPVGTLAIGKAGATNAGLLAVAHPGDVASGAARTPARLSRRADRQGARGSLAVSRVILPGATIGVLGSGQLGRMMAIAARRMGYRVHTLSPGEDTPTGQVADLEITADYEDLDAIRAFAKGVHVVTFEFENVSTEAAAAAAARSCRCGRAAPRCTSRSSARARRRFSPITDSRRRRAPRSARSTSSPSRSGWIGAPAIVKTAAFGYDGKGQHRSRRSKTPSACGVSSATRKPSSSASSTSRTSCRSWPRAGSTGDFAHFGAIENTHRNHILDLSVAPARIPESTAAEAVEITRAIMEALDYVGVLCVEFFLTTDGRLLVNEIAPRPHNSGHLTFDACLTSQFEQQVRAVCGLPLGSTRLLRPAAMVNLLGDLWVERRARLGGALAFPDVKLHLYGKDEARPGRKMGHLTALADTVEEAIEHALGAREMLA